MFKISLKNNKKRVTFSLFFDIINLKIESREVLFMKETLICKLDKHSIYYLNNSNYGFYIFVPFKDYNDTNITIRLKSNYEMYDLNKNDLTKVTNELINYYKNIDSYNITLILPIFYNDILSRIRVVCDMNLYHQMDKYLGEIFNYAYSFLTKNNIKVNNNIYFINNDSFKTFTNWYVSRYNNRIEYKTVIDLVKENGSYHDYDVVKTPNMNFVVGKEKEPKLEKTIDVELETFDNMLKEAQREEKNSGTNSGFVSYILLGIITFVVSLALLFVLIK